MEKAFRRDTLINLAIVAAIVVAGFVQSLMLEETVANRKARAIIGYFVVCPLLLASAVFTIGIVRYYLNKKAIKEKLYIYLNIPGFLLWLYIFSGVIGIFIKVNMD